MKGTACLIALLLLLGCPAIEQRFDFDGDGVEDQLDCAPEDPAIYPDADDPYGDGQDTNCDGLDGLDADGDGYPGNEDLQDQPELWDCNDSDETIHPGADLLLPDFFVPRANSSRRSARRSSPRVDASLFSRSSSGGPPSGQASG